MKKSKILKGMILSAMICIASISCHKDKEVTVPVTGVKLNKHDITLVTGAKEVLIANVLPANATNKKVVWASKDLKIATVDAAGSVTAVSAGKTTIFVATEDKAKTDSCVVTVTDKAIPVTGVSVTPTAASVEINKTVKITAKVLPDNATNKKVTWKSSDANIATVDTSGTVTGKKEGKATITVTTEDGAKTATCAVTVTASSSVAVTGVKVDPTAASVEVNKTVKITATVEPATATNKKVSWKSSDESVATVDANGTVTGKKAGSATVTVTTEDGGKTATCAITVTAASVAVTGVKVEPTTASVGVNKTVQITATVEPANATNKKVTWKSSDESVATVDANGMVTGKKAGSATVTVTTEDGAKTANCAVTVTA
ncbi:MAG: Ig-like domain-containing protein [Prevotellaceae bacterium]|jgi:uncharacterized protein YjdB|nr:Ig-like domain-containing protein [Prevotellaceae bacterium]